jgi:hypothetical protein
MPIGLGENDRFVWVTLNLPVFNNSKGNLQYQKRPYLQGISISRSETTSKRVAWVKVRLEAPSLLSILRQKFPLPSFCL